MRFVDPYALRLKTPRETLIFAVRQHAGNKPIQEDAFLNFNDECFVLADGVGSLPNADVASKFAAETAVWGYKLIRQHRYYWLDKKLFMKRIFRSTNMAVWQKRREVGFEEGLATKLMVCMVGPKTFWLGYTGDSGAWIIRDGAQEKLTGELSPFEGKQKGILGMKRLGLSSEYVSGQFKTGNILLLATGGCANYLAPSDLQAGSAASGDTEGTLGAASEALIQAALRNGSEEDMTVVMIKRVKTV